MKANARMLILPIIISTAILIASVNSYAQWLPYTGLNFYDSLYGYWNQPYYEYVWDLPYDYGWNYLSYSLGSHYNSSSYIVFMFSESISRLLGFIYFIAFRVGLVNQSNLILRFRF